MIPLIHFKLYIINADLLFDKVFCHKDQLNFQFHIENKMIINVDIHFNYINLNSCKLISTNTDASALLLESVVDKRGITLGSKQQDRIGFLLTSNDVTNKFLAKKFYKLLLKIIHNFQTKKR
ncbi:hypothetical protein [uncultured Kordia sp.]|uniref:hypothetical protein n=1 Tax=uncultured Kordia sp. TaxID=507699 RepID=UPI002603E54D|nr:hypothetical protein [uncultured Kordia sp.]